MEKQGIIIAPGTIRFERRLKGPIEKVWAYLTEPDKRSKWFAGGEMELFVGGKADFTFDHQTLSPIAGGPPEKYKDMKPGEKSPGVVTQIDPPRLLSFLWEKGSQVTFELTESEGAVILVLTHERMPQNRDFLLSVSAGWHTHLEILVDNLAGVVPPNFWGMYTEMEGFYAEQIKAPSGETGMLIRKPVAEVFNAFVDPAVTTKFWFTKGSGKLGKGAAVQWVWEMYDFSADVLVKDLVEEKRIEIEWAGSRAVWSFEAVAVDATFVRIVVDGFTGDAETISRKITDQVAGFCWVLAGAKAYLEFGVQLNLVGDRFPGGK